MSNENIQENQPTPPNDSEPPAGERRVFATEVQQLLNLMVHSLYSKREVFLRELISNASDALDTLRFLSLTNPELRPSNEPAIDLTIDKEARTLTLSDNGIGMTRDEVIKNIGTIAHSGTGALLARLKAQNEAKPNADREAPDGAASVNLIGQFGVGFYSAFMVADRIDLTTLSAHPGSEAVAWSSDGGGAYTIGPARGRDNPGTTITLKLKADADEFLDEWRLEQIVKQFSNFVKWPIRVTGAEPRTLNQSTALWARRPAEVTDEEHKSFFRELMGGFAEDDYLTKIHLSLDAPYQFQALLYIPKKPPFDLMVDGQKHRGVQLYVRRVFILDHAEELLPPYLRFVRGVVDSDDLPLNVSREILQKNQVISAIQKQLVKKTLEELKRIKSERPDDYRAFFDEFGVILKEGLFLDHGNRDRLAELVLYGSLKTPEDKVIDLAQYVAAMPAAQKDIYYLTGPSRAQVENSPHLEALRARGLDALFLIDAVDEWVVQGLSEFQGKKLVPVHKGDLVLPTLAELKPEGDKGDKGDKDQGTDKEGQDGKDKKAEPDAPSPEDQVLIGGLVAHLRVRYQDVLQEVRSSQRLTDSPSCLVAGAGDLGRNMEQILRRANRKVPEQKPILELNPQSPFVLALARRYQAEPLAPDVAAYCDLLLELAFLSQGTVRKPAQLIAELGKVLTRDIGRGA